MICCVLLIAAALLGMVFTGCANTTDYSQEIREYQEKLESLQAENEELRAQLGAAETETDETEAVPEETESAAEETAAQETESAEESQAEAAETEVPEEESQAVEEEETGLEPKVESTTGILQEGGVTKVLVLGDSIWGNDRDETGVAARVEYYMEKLGYKTKVYNAAVGGTRATIDYDDSEWTYGPGSDNSLGKMISILSGNTDVEQLQGIAAYEVMKEAIADKDDIDLVILAYGMNDFLCQVELNNSDRYWVGFGTALNEGVSGATLACPHAQVMIVAPSYASYFSIPVQNMGEKALYNYASVACDIAKKRNTLCVDAYNNLGIGIYTADEYLEDGVHLNEKGRDLYARAIAANMVYGQTGQISGNALPLEAFE